MKAYGGPSKLIAHSLQLKAFMDRNPFYYALKAMSYTRPGFKPAKEYQEATAWNTIWNLPKK